jgi:hypothetical protein
MELAALFHLLWARRIVVGLGAFLAIAAGVLVAQRASPAPAPRAAVSAEVLLDTRSSQLAAAVPAEVDTLPTRAFLLGELMTTDRFRTLVANQAGVPATQVDVLGPPSAAVPPVQTPSVLQASTFSTISKAPYVLSLTADGQSPTISIEADAPNAAAASRLATAGIRVMQSAVASEQTGYPQPFVVETVSPPQPKALVVHSRRPVEAVVGALAIFILCCAGIVLHAGVTRGRRRPQPA